MRTRRHATRWWWSAPARSAWHWRSTSRSSGVPVVLLDNDDRLSTGSRAICFAKRTLEIFDRLGVGHALVDKGVSWNIGRVFLRDQAIYSFDLLPEDDHERPAFINLQQYYVEGYLVERAMELPLVDLRWKNEVVGGAPAGRWRDAAGANARRRLHDRRRPPGGLRRHALERARVDRPGGQGPHRSRIVS